MPAPTTTSPSVANSALDTRFPSNRGYTQVSPAPVAAAWGAAAAMAAMTAITAMTATTAITAMAYKLRAS